MLIIKNVAFYGESESYEDHGTWKNTACFYKNLMKEGLEQRRISCNTTIGISLVLILYTKGKIIEMFHKTEKAKDYRDQLLSSAYSVSRGQIHVLQ